ncbi:mycothiol transferase [Streptacidiphilus sp. PAMC 29251]
MTATSITPLADAFDRIKETVEDVLDGLGPDDLSARLDPDANSIGWLVWHLTRVQDDHVAKAADVPQIWHSGDWQKRFDLPYPADAHGYGQSSSDVDAFRDVPAALLAQYHGAVHAQTLSFLDTLADADLQRVVDESWQPPVTLSVRLVSVIADDLQHVGQAAFVRGVLRRRRSS